MKLYYWRGKNGLENFGDKLNKLIWDYFLPGVCEGNPKHLFIGIGTLLNNKLPHAEKVTILGTGVGYGILPVSYSNWEILCVRGPLSAQSLKLDTSFSITDPAILVRNIYLRRREAKYEYSFMPHWQNDTSFFKKICNKLDIRYISPLQNTDYIIEEILKTRHLITEAMHGAIVADSLRVPWICIQDPLNPDYLPFKWIDWTMSMNLEYSPNLIPNEQFNTIAGNSYFALLYREHTISRFLKHLKKDGMFILSDEDILESKCMQLEKIIGNFKKKYGIVNLI